MKITEAENALPNGLHDAELLEVRVDYATRTAALDFMADYSDPEKVREEADRKVTVLVTGLHFISIPAPDLEHKYSVKGSSQVGGFHAFEPTHPVSDEVKAATRHLPSQAFCECTFVEEWNRCLVVAAENARIDIEQ